MAWNSRSPPPEPTRLAKRWSIELLLYQNLHHETVWKSDSLVMSSRPSPASYTLRWSYQMLVDLRLAIVSAAAPALMFMFLRSTLR